MGRLQRSAAGVCALVVVSLSSGCVDYGGGCRDGWGYSGYSGCGHFETGDPLAGAFVAGFVVIVLIADALGRVCGGHGCR